MSQTEEFPSPPAPRFYYLEVEGDFGQQQFGVDIHQVSILVTEVPLWGGGQCEVTVKSLPGTPED